MRIIAGSVYESHCFCQKVCIRIIRLYKKSQDFGCIFFGYDIPKYLIFRLGDRIFFEKYRFIFSNLDFPLFCTSATISRKRFERCYYTVSDFYSAVYSGNIIFKIINHHFCNHFWILMGNLKYSRFGNISKIYSIRENAVRFLKQKNLVYMKFTRAENILSPLE